MALTSGWRRLVGAMLVAAATRVPARADCRVSGPGPALGLALGGGGARGMAHVGVLQELEASGVRPDCIAGTSAGAVIGALFAAGYSARRIEELVRSLDWQEVFRGRPERELVPLSLRAEEVRPLLRVAFDRWKVRLPVSRDSDYRVNRLLFRLLAGPSLAAKGDFDRLPIPFRAVATDLATGERVVLARGRLERAARASMSTPVSLPPVELDGRVLVDGGVVDNLPVDVAREMGAGVVIAVDTTSPRLLPEQYRDAVGIAAQTADVLMRARNADFAAPADLTMAPPLGRRSNNDYGDIGAVIEAGRQAARAETPRARELAGAGNHPPSPPPAALEGRPLIEIDVRGHERVRASLIRTTLGLAPGGPLRMEEALRGLDAVWATRLFDSAWLEADEAEGGVRLTAHVKEAVRRRVEVGGGYDEAHKARGFLRLVDRNLFGGGERLSLTGRASHQEVGVLAGLVGDRLGTLPLGFALTAHRLEEKPRFFRVHENVGRAEFDRLGASAALQVRLGPAALGRVLLLAGRVRTEPRPDATFVRATDDVRVLSGSLLWDSLDDRELPTSGGRLFASVERNLRGLGARHSHWRATGSASWAVPWRGRAVSQVQLFAGLSGDAVPLYDLFRLGGPELLPGYHRDELWGRQALAGAVSQSVRLAGLRLTLRAGAGDVRDERRDLSLRDLRYGFGVGIARPTPLGPVAVDWGKGDGGGAVLSLTLGHR